MLTLAALVTLAAAISSVNAVPPPHVPMSECRSLMDICFVVDSSDSISLPNYEKLRKALAAIVMEMDLGPNKARVCLVVYSSTIPQFLPLTHDVKLLNDTITTMIHEREGTNTDRGLAKMVELFKLDQRPDVPKVGVLITDGISKHPIKTAAQAEIAKGIDTNMFAVGIGSLIQRSELDAVASSPGQVLELTTFDQLRDSLSKMMKVVCPCPLPFDLPFATLGKGGRAIGTQRTYSCIKGYQAMGNGVMTCQPDATWSLLDFSCHVCVEPTPITNAELLPGDVFVGSMREYVCMKGYTAPILLNRTCTPGPTGPMWTDIPWKDPRPVCSPCDLPIPPPNSAPDRKYPTTLIADTWNFKCNHGFAQTGPLGTTCVDNLGFAEWTPIVGSCITCDEPPPLPHSDADNQGGVLVNAERQYLCKTGYHPNGPMLARCLVGNGTIGWHVSPHRCVDCGDPIPVPNTRLESPKSKLVGTVLVYSCIKGYQATGPIEQVCTTKDWDAFWYGPNHTCVACSAPPPVPNAYIDPVYGDTLIGSIYGYSCNEGYLPSGPIRIGCIKGIGGPLWTDPEFQCIMCDMPPPDHVPNAWLLDYGDNKIGSTRQYECLKGYVPSRPGPVTTQCIGEYTSDRGRAYWGAPSHFCIACPDPPHMDNAHVDAGDNLVGSSRRYRCTGDYHETGPIIIDCMKDATWLLSKHSCKACGPPERVLDAILLDGPQLIGTVRQYKCADGLTPTAEPSVICRKNATWSGVHFACVKCPPIYPLENAQADSGLETVWAVRSYTCIQGYVPTGLINSTCEVKAKYALPDWSMPKHHCRDCGPPHPVPLAEPILGPWTTGSIQHYQCNPGFTPSGPAVSHCTRDGFWTMPEFKCITCDPPPPVRNAFVTKAGGVQVGNIRQYECGAGYLKTGPIEYMCTDDIPDGFKRPDWRNLTDNYCLGCQLELLLPVPYSKKLPVMVADAIIGAEIVYECAKGYLHTNAPIVTCLPNAQWSELLFECALTCYDPPTYKDSMVDKVGGIFVGNTREYVCNGGLQHVGDMRVTCGPDGLWSPRNFECKMCTDPPLGDYITLPVDAGPRLLFEKVHYTCAGGYAATGDAFITCEPGAVWSKLLIGCSNCKLLPNVILAEPSVTLPADGVNVGDTIPYTCKGGFISAVPVTATCKPDLTWDMSAFGCGGCSDSLVPKVTHAAPMTKVIGDAAIGTELLYECIHGYLHTDTPMIVCQGNGEWSGPLFECIVTCYDPPPYTDAFVDTVGGIFINNVREYRCNDGLAAFGDMKISCGPDGLWSKRNFECKMCTDPPLGDYITLAVDAGPRLLFEKVHYACAGGYAATGDPFITCEPGAVWSKLKIGCSNCKLLPNVILAEPSVTIPADGVNVGDTIPYTCKGGFISAVPVKATCKPDLTWDMSAFGCGGCSDSLVPKVTHAAPMTKVIGDAAIGTEILYECIHGYLHTDTPMIVCQGNGEWSGPLFECIVTCYDPPPYTDAFVDTVGGIFINNVREYRCNDGLAAFGDMKISCGPDGLWSKRNFECKMCTDPPLGDYITLAVDAGPRLLFEKVHYACAGGYAATGDPFITCEPGAVWSKLKIGCSNCKLLPNMILAEPSVTIPADGVNVGDTIPYTCKGGFISAVPVKATCKPDLTWDTSAFGCGGCSDSLVPKVTHAAPMTKVIGDAAIGTELLYECIHGYLHTDIPMIVCQGNGEWSGPLFECIVTCYDPPPYTDAFVDTVGGIFINNVREYRCNDGLAAFGDMKISCGPDGLWSKRNFECKMCTDPPLGDYITLAVDAGPKLLFEKVHYACAGGYAATGDPFITCEPGAVWSKLKIGCSNCKLLPNVILAEPSVTIPVDGVNVGDTIPYTCKGGFISAVPVKATCKPDLTWDMSAFGCGGCSDSLVPKVTNAAAVTKVIGDAAVGTELLYECIHGYLHTDTPMIVCQGNGEWSGPLFECIVTCYDPPPYTDAFVDTVGGIFINNVREYRCNDGLAAFGDMKISCGPDGLWSKRNFECKMCTDPPLGDYITLAVDAGPRLLFEKVHYACAGGYAATGDPFITCEPGAVWSKLKIGCSNCKLLPNVVLAEPSVTIPADGVNVGDTIPYTCKGGFISAVPVKATCKPDLTWDMSAFGCGGCSDSLVPKVTHAAPMTKVIGDAAVGTELLYECIHGYLHTDTPMIVCQGNGEWSGPLFECIVTCYVPPPYTDAFVDTVGGIFINNVREYRCNDGLAAFGDMKITCGPDGLWSKRHFECKMCSDPPLGDYITLPVDAGPRRLLEKVHYTCAGGYSPTGNTFISCEPGAVWSKLQIGCSNCKLLPNVTLAEPSVTIPADGVNVGDSIPYTCFGGFISAVPVKATCKPDLTWDMSAIGCGGCSERLVPKITHATLMTKVVGDAVLGTELLYECKHGYLHTDIPSIVCQGNAEWSLPLFECIVTCYDPPTNTDAFVDTVGGIFIGNVREYTCSDGLQAFGNMKITCGPDGLWSKRNFECKMCTDPPLGDYITLPVDAGPRLLFEKVHYACAGGYAATGDAFITCELGAVWSKLQIGCSNCKLLPNVILAEPSVTIPVDGVNVGDTIPYTCLGGFISAVPVKITCKPDLTWDMSALGCGGCSESLVPKIKHATLMAKVKGDAVLGTELLYECKHGYLHTDTPSIVCQGNAEWSLPLFECIVTCYDPPPYTDAFVDTVGGIFIGNVREYACSDGLQAFGEMKITCGPDGLWSKRSFECKMCTDPPLGDYITLPVDAGPRLLYEKVHYTCAGGYAATGDAFITCELGAVWSKLKIGCSNCKLLPNVILAEPSVTIPADGVSVGDTIPYTCKGGFISAVPVKATCKPDLTWDMSAFGCGGCSDSLVPKITHATIMTKVKGDAILGTELLYECKHGYLHTDTPSVVCQGNAEWSLPLFECIVTCYDPPPFTDAFVDTVGGIFIGNVREYACNDGLHAVGDMKITCGPDGLWSKRNFECKMCVNPPPGDYITIAIEPGPRRLFEKVHYTCATGYAAIGDTFITCETGAVWSELRIGCSNCKLLPAVILAEPSVAIPMDGVNVGETIPYTCLGGFISAVPIVATCKSDLTWAVSDIGCRGCSPKLVPRIPYSSNVTMVKGEAMIGTELLYTCDHGYLHTGKPSVVCMDNAEWSQPVFECAVTCYEPEHYTDAVLDVGGTFVGDTRVYTCNDGFHPVGNMMITCKPSGMWSKRKFECKMCADPSLGDYITVAIDAGPRLQWETVNYKCNNGYVPTGDTFITCEPGAIWSPLLIGCSNCKSLPEVTFAEPSVTVPVDGVNVGDTIPYTCKGGYMSDLPVTAKCQMDLTWLLSVKGCRGCKADQIPGIVNGFNATAVIGDVGIGTQLLYECQYGFLHTAIPTVVCLVNAQWSKPVFECVVTCYDPETYTDAMISGGTTFVGDTREYKCNEGLWSVGDMKISCGPDGHWSKRNFRCKMCIDPPLGDYTTIPLDPGSRRQFEKVHYKCAGGYVATGETFIVCEMGAVWTKLGIGCSNCRVPPPLTFVEPFPKVELEGINVGDMIVYSCMKGFVSDVVVTATCLENLTWKLSTTGCRGCRAELMPTIVNGFNTTMVIGDALVGTEILYECQHGFLQTAIPSITCMDSGQWSTPVFDCVVSCFEAPVYDDAFIEMAVDISQKGKGKVGDVVVYKCKDKLEPVGDMSIICQKTGQWSPRNFECRQCAGPPPGDHITIAIDPHLPRRIYETVQYQCANGYVPTGDTVVTCLPGAVWSPLLIGCSNCRVPPPLTFVEPFPKVELEGINVGDMIVYSCMKGFVSDVTVTATCLANLKWDLSCGGCKGCLAKDIPLVPNAVPPAYLAQKVFKVGARLQYKCLARFAPTAAAEVVCSSTAHWTQPQFQCVIDCGQPPDIRHGYVSLGATTLGAKREYTCQKKYELSVGSGIIECLASGLWSEAGSIACQLVPTTTMAPTPPLADDPSVCDRCRLQNGVGYNPHPFDCTMYVQCFFGPRGGIEAVYMPCPFEQYWHQDKLTCLPAEYVDCPNERCLKQPDLISYKHSDKTKCCAYWECHQGKSVAQCCGEGFRYENLIGCVPDPSCKALCPFQDFLPACDKRPMFDLNRYEVHIGNDFWVKMRCPPGTAFNLLDCQCSFHTGVIPNYVCLPELQLDFDNGRIADVSGRNVHVENVGVSSYNGTAYFNGSARLLVSRFSNAKFRGHLVVKMRYKEIFEGPYAAALQALVSNGDCGDDPSIIIAKMPGYVLLGATTGEPKSFALPTVDKEWKEVIFIHDENKLEGKVCGASFSKWSLGPIKSTHCGLQIGYGTGLNSFHGYMDDVYLYQCLPQENVLSIYGGRRFRAEDDRGSDRGERGGAIGGDVGDEREKISMRVH